jgi:hypothetical protein
VRAPTRAAILSGSRETRDYAVSIEKSVKVGQAQLSVVRIETSQVNERNDQCNGSTARPFRLFVQKTEDSSPYALVAGFLEAYCLLEVLTSVRK